MKPLVLSFLAIVAFQTLCYADVTKLSANDQKALREVSHFHKIQAATNLPPAIFALCADDKGRLAEPGQKWQVTDVITDEKLPMRRLIWAVTDGETVKKGRLSRLFHRKSHRDSATAGAEPTDSATNSLQKGTATASQPLHSETNTTPAAAGLQLGPPH